MHHIVKVEISNIVQLQSKYLLHLINLVQLNIETLSNIIKEKTPIWKWKGRKEEEERTNIQPKDNTHQCKNKYRGCNKVVGKVDCNKKILNQSFGRLQIPTLQIGMFTCSKPNTKRNHVHKKGTYVSKEHNN
jgi:hypothetical protein